MSGGYTYTVINAHPGEPARIGVSFYLDEHAWITVPGAGGTRPHLHIAHGEVSVSIGPRDETVTAEDVVLAHKLADQAAAYAAEIERLRASHDASGSGTTAA
ncbi:MAG: hypothetical protein ACRDNZ_19345 [Streptosporangiaceae bacterium]